MQWNKLENGANQMHCASECYKLGGASEPTGTSLEVFEATKDTNLTSICF